MGRTIALLVTIGVVWAGVYYAHWVCVRRRFVTITPGQLYQSARMEPKRLMMSRHACWNTCGALQAAKYRPKAKSFSIGNFKFGLSRPFRCRVATPPPASHLRGPSRWFPTSTS